MIADTGRDAVELMLFAGLSPICPSIEFTASNLVVSVGMSKKSEPAPRN